MTELRCTCGYLLTYVTDICPVCLPNGLRDPRDPDYSRPGIFADHNCWRCKDGAQPCVRGNPRQCEYPHARND